MLCWPGESGGSAGWGHPHPSFSPDGTRVLYNSDATGAGQIYLAIDRGVRVEGQDSFFIYRCLRPTRVP